MLCMLQSLTLSPEVWQFGWGSPPFLPSRGIMGCMVSGERRAVVCLFIKTTPLKWTPSCLASSCLLYLSGWGLWKRVCCLSHAWVSLWTTRVCFLIDPRHRLGILMLRLCWYFFNCLMKMGRYAKRLFNSVLTSDQCLKPLKRKRKKNIFFFKCSSCSMMWLSNNFLDRDGN